MLVNSSSNSWAIIGLSPPKSGCLCGYKKLYILYKNLICNISLTNIKCSSNLGSRIDNIVSCNARRRVRYEDEEDEDDSYGYNEELAILEMYSQSARGEALIVTAMVDDQQAEVLIFKVIHYFIVLNLHSLSHYFNLPLELSFFIIDY